MATLRATHPDQAINEAFPNIYIAKKLRPRRGYVNCGSGERVDDFYSSQLGGIGDDPALYRSYVDLKSTRKIPEAEKTTDGANSIQRSPSCSTAKLLKAAAVKAAAAKAA